MKPKKARRILQQYLNHYELPIWTNYIRQVNFSNETIKEYNFRELLKIAYKLKDK